MDPVKEVSAVHHCAVETSARARAEQILKGTYFTPKGKKAEKTKGIAL